MIRNVLIALAIASTAVAQEFKPYLSLSGGYAYLEADDRDGTDSDKADSGYVIEGAVGLAYREDVNTGALRAELALSSQNNVFEETDGDVDVRIAAAMLNGYFDIFTYTAFTPYFLVGIGRANVDYDESGGISDDTYTLAYQFGGGVGYSITDHVILDLKYKYFGTDDGDIIPRLTSHQVQLGVRYQF